MADLGRSTQDLRQGARDVADHPWLENLARVGYASSGLLHVLIGWIAAQVALDGGRGGEADQSGALEQLRSAPFGAVLLWVVVVGFVALCVWQALEAAVGASETKDRLKAGGKALLYAALAGTALSVARGGSSSSSRTSSDLTAQVLHLPGGRILVGLVGLGVVAAGVYHVWNGLTRHFLKDLRTTGGGRVGQGVEWSGVIGYAAKGVALGVLGLLLLVAAWQADPKESTGLDGALKTLAQQPFGTVLLLLVALGLVAFGVYSFARARYGRL